jgi:hypothetical protein
MRRAVAVLLVALLPGLASAQAPGSLQIVDVKVEKDRVEWAEYKAVPVQKTVAVTVLVNGMQVVENRTVTVTEMVAISRIYEIKDLKATDATGKAIPADKLAGLLKETPSAVVTTGPIPEKHRALFKDKTVFLELPQPKPVKG